MAATARAQSVGARRGGDSEVKKFECPLVKGRNMIALDVTDGQTTIVIEAAEAGTLTAVFFDGK